MRKYIKRIAIVLFAVILVSTLLTGCIERESDVVSRNVSKEADNFNVMRRLTVFNIRTDTVLMQMTGRFAIKNEGNDELSIICEVDKGVYQKHFVYLNDYTMYTVEDLSGANVSPYAYEFEFLPQTLIPVKITANELKEDFRNMINDEP